MRRRGNEERWKANVTRKVAPDRPAIEAADAAGAEGARFTAGRSIVGSISDRVASLLRGANLQEVGWCWGHLLPLNFRTAAAPVLLLIAEAQKKGTVKDVQGLLRHSRAATTTDVYMQEIPESVRATINAIHAELRMKPKIMQAG